MTCCFQPPCKAGTTEEDVILPKSPVPSPSRFAPISPLSCPVAVDGALLGAEQVGVADGRQGDRGKVEALGELPLVVGETPQFFSVAGVHATQAAGDVEEEGAAQQHQSPELEGSPAPVGKRTGLRLAHLTF